MHFYLVIFVFKITPAYTERDYVQVSVIWKAINALPEEKK